VPDQPPSPEVVLSPKRRSYIIVASLLVLFLGALDALVMSAAMPTIVSDLGSMNLYSWVFSAYLLTRAISLPLFGKLADLFTNKTLFAISIAIFILGSIFAGLSQNMTQLILSRVFQGIGAGGNFALVYIVLADISSPEKRGKTLSFASFIWGLASVLGPTIGGVIVTYFSWRWIFFINVPIGGISLLGIFLYLIEVREKKKEIAIDAWGSLSLTVSVLSLLTACLLAGQHYKWTSPHILGLLVITVGFAVVLFHIEKRAKEPILPIEFFKLRGFSIGNAASFFSSFAIFSLFAFSPLFIQGALGKTPLQLAMAMLSLSLGWSIGALFCGQAVQWLRKKPSAIAGGILMVSGCGTTLMFSAATSLIQCAVVFFIVGLGMGFVSIPTLLIVQDSVDNSDLGVATSSHQFARTLGGTVGIGIAGSFVSERLSGSIEALRISGLLENMPASLQLHLQTNLENIFQPEILAQLSTEVQKTIQNAVVQGVMRVFWLTLLVSLITFALCVLLPRRRSL
jgi:EmrB/QacA subfamily drug resistance transporter